MNATVVHVYDPTSSYILYLGILALSLNIVHVYAIIAYEVILYMS